MKKFFLLVLLTVVGVSAYAQKKYLVVSGTAQTNMTENHFYLSGDIPSGYTKMFYTIKNIGELLNDLVEEGFVVEHFSSAPTGSTSTSIVNVLLSRSSNYEDDAISIVHNDDSEAYEVARYNLQGMQVNENTKGIQIIVYSNYTTKTVIVE